MTKEQILKEYFGYDCFREGQEPLINSLLKGQDVLGVMPTGAGKSICFQVPAMLLEGITLVISPLISLMKDQVNALTQVGIGAAFLNSSQSMAEYNKTLEDAMDKKYKILYVAPERLMAESFLDFAESAKIAMVTVDEAHCISQWGQDFRPSYTKILDFIQRLSVRPIVSAFTATATAQVREDIVKVLKLQNPEVLITGFDRKNLYFEVQKPKKKLDALMDFLEDKENKTGVIYCSTRKNVEAVCEKLKKEGFNATRYHAGLSDEERRINQEDFIFDRASVIVATNAFGMGIDKSNVSYVVHYNMPKNIESYYQEAGRAGRDGEPAECILFYSGQDVRTNLFFIENNRDVDYVDSQTEAMVKERDRERLKEMTFYCHTSDCLRGYILKYFGESSENFCDYCSNCKQNFETLDISLEAQKILSCVYRVEGRYGIRMIVDILRGSKNERILKLGLDKVSTYGIVDVSEKRLRDMINFLVLKEYLLITNDEYPVLKLSKNAHEVLKERKTIEIKLPKEVEKVKKSEKKTANEKEENPSLVEALKALRRSIAKEQGVPAYIVFSDSSLKDMARKLPENEDEFLDVSGVGAVKLERYGEEFLKVITGFIEDKREIDHEI